MENLLMTIFAAGTQALNTIAALGEDFITGGAAAETTKAIWNFAHTDLNVPKDVVVENVHLFDSLMRLSYNLSSYEKE